MKIVAVLTNNDKEPEDIRSSVRALSIALKKLCKNKKQFAVFAVIVDQPGKTMTEISGILQENEITIPTSTLYDHLRRLRSLLLVININRCWYPTEVSVSLLGFIRIYHRYFEEGRGRIALVTEHTDGKSILIR